MALRADLIAMEREEAELIARLKRAQEAQVLGVWCTPAGPGPGGSNPTDWHCPALRPRLASTLPYLLRAQANAFSELEHALMTEVRVSPKRATKTASVISPR
jgi:hypothetical protein